MCLTVCHAVGTSCMQGLSTWREAWKNQLLEAPHQSTCDAVTQPPPCAPLSPCEELPDDLLRRVLEVVMLRSDGQRQRCWWSGTVRGLSRRWRAIHDGVCQTLCVDDGVTDEVIHALCGRLPALTFLWLNKVKSLTEDGLRAVGGLNALAFLHLGGCANVTDAVLRELRGLSALTWLYLDFCTDVTDVVLRELRGLTKLTRLNLYGCSNVTNTGLQELRDLTALTWLSLSFTKVTNDGLRHLTSLTALTTLHLSGTSTTRAGRNALKAALPAVTAYWWIDDQ